ncbi:MAG TPA: hypothetical protein VHE99_04090 [Gammaproteobacteria bacterium]|nr:hypothetical protein [Gammaproteobacteria bacterium]
MSDKKETEMGLVSSFPSSSGSSGSSSFAELPKSVTYANLSASFALTDNYVGNSTDINDQCGKNILAGLKEISSLISETEETAAPFVKHIKEIDMALDLLGNNELSFSTKNKISFALNSFEIDFENYISTYFPDNYEFIKTVMKLTLKLNDELSPDAKNTLYIIYELKNVLKLLLEHDKEQISKAHDRFDIHFEAIDASLKKIKQLPIELKGKTSKLVDNILGQARMDEFYSPANQMVLNKLNSLLLGSSDKKQGKRPSSIPQSFYSQQKSEIPSTLDSKKTQREEAFSIIEALGQIKQLIPDCTKTSDPPNYAPLSQEFAKIKVILESLKQVEKIDLEGFEGNISSLLGEIREIIIKNQFYQFYEDEELSSTLSELEYLCRYKEIYVAKEEINYSTFEEESRQTKSSCILS